MSDKITQVWGSYSEIIVIVIATAIVLGFVTFFMPSPSRGIIERSMTNGDTCYTFNNSIDCTQTQK